MLEAAQQGGVKRGAVEAYVTLQHTPFVGFLSRKAAWIRNRLIYDDRFLFKVRHLLQGWFNTCMHCVPSVRLMQHNVLPTAASSA